VVVTTARKHNIPRCGWKNPSKLRDEGNEVRREIFLQVRQIAPIELHAEIVSP